MATSMPSFSPHPGGMQQHPGVPPGHHMAPGMVHNPSQPGSQPGGIPHQLAHMGVSAPGGQVNQAALMQGMPPGGPNAHAMQHLNPQMAQQLFHQQQQMQNCMSHHHAHLVTSPTRRLTLCIDNINPQLTQQMQQQRLQQLQVHQQNATRQALMQQQGQYGMPMGMGGLSHMNPQQVAQFQALRMQQAQGRPVALPPHLQQAHLAQHNQQQVHNPQAQVRRYSRRIDCGAACKEARWSLANMFSSRRPC